MREWLMLPNLLSLSRIPLGCAVGYCLYVDTPAATIVAALLTVTTGITDALDGYLARRSGHVTRLGVALDPICDKLFALVMVAALILFRSFPFWLALVVVGRDAVILLGGLLLTRREKVELPSNLPGKYAFAALAVLLGAHVIRFQFSIELMTPIVVVLIGWSLWSYGKVFYYKWHNRAIPQFQDRRTYAVIRKTLVWAVAVAHFVMFYFEKLR